MSKKRLKLDFTPGYRTALLDGCDYHESSGKNEGFILQKTWDLSTTINFLRT